MTVEAHQWPRVGVGALIFKDGKILLGKRKSKHAPGTYAPPGGKLDLLESFTDALLRETAEECGIKIKNIKFLCVYNLKEYPPDHFINFGFTADWEGGDPQVLEPEKMESWGWYAIDELPQPIFASIPYFVQALKTGQTFFDK